MKPLAGVTASGEPGKEPKVSFHTPMTVENKAYAVLQKGNGATVEEGDHVCAQGIALSAKDGSQMANSWTKNTPDCSMSMSPKAAWIAAYYQLFKGQKINATIAFGVNDQQRQLVHHGADVHFQVEGPDARRGHRKVDGHSRRICRRSPWMPKASLRWIWDGYKPGDTLVTQPLIVGKGRTVTENDTVTANYTGWTLDSSGKLIQFDSSWDRGAPSDFSLEPSRLRLEEGADRAEPSARRCCWSCRRAKAMATRPPARFRRTATLYFVVDILYAG
jgi:peptidylprolyl isomerase